MIDAIVTIGTFILALLTLLAVGWAIFKIWKFTTHAASRLFDVCARRR